MTSEEIGFVPMRKGDKRNKKGKRNFKVGSRKRDPLQTFKARKARK